MGLILYLVIGGIVYSIWEGTGVAIYILGTIVLGVFGLSVEIKVRIKNKKAEKEKQRIIEEMRKQEEERKRQEEIESAKHRELVKN